MTGPARLAGEVFVSHNVFFLVDRDYFPGGGPRITFGGNGLAVVIPGIVAVCTGIHTGKVDLSVEQLDERPKLDSESWEDVVDVSIDVPIGELHATTLMYGVPDNLESPVTSRAGLHGVRVHARGRDISPDGTASEPFEFYLVQVWPEVKAIDQVHKLTSRFGQGHRK